MYRAILLMICSMSLIPFGDSFGKLLIVQHGVHPIFVAWSRFALGALLLLPFLNARHFQLRLYLNWRIWLRGALLAGGVSSILTALQTEPLQNVIGAFFVGPIISYFLAALFLKERITTARTLLMFVGFVGILLVIQPSGDMGTGLWFALLAGAFYGSFLTTGRWLSNAAPPRALLLSQLVIASLILLPFGAQHIPQFSTPILLLTFGSALASMLGNLLLVFAYKLQGASRLAPFVYVQLVAATLYSYVFFNETPDAMAAIGLSILILSGGLSATVKR